MSSAGSRRRGPPGRSTRAGGLLAAGTLRSTIDLWNLASREKVATLTGHNNLVTSVCFSPDGRRLLSASGDATVRMWDPVTRRLLLRLDAGSEALDVAFSPDGDEVAAACVDRTIRIWRLDAYDADMARNAGAFMSSARSRGVAFDERAIRARLGDAR